MSSSARDKKLQECSKLTIVGFRVAGRDTTSCTLTYATKFLHENVEALKRLSEEGLFELGERSLSHNRRITWDDTRSNPYVDAVINEVLRLAPPVR